MEHQNTAAGKAVAVCFLAIWIMVVIFMGSIFLGMPLMSEGFFIVILIPFAMAAFGVVLCIAIAKSNTGVATARRMGSGYSISTTGDAMYSDSHSTAVHSPESSRRVVFKIPPECPSCGASLNSEQVEWIGPLQAQCPYCLATIEAAERDF
ncbi:MAG: hypothetical protein ACFFD6_01470 [Candidatus Thorarchaeota archaeon]